MGENTNWWQYIDEFRKISDFLTFRANYNEELAILGGIN